MLKYKAFTSSHDFEEWQAESEDAKIVQVQPMPTSMDLSESERGARGEMSLSVFVVYREQAD